jgi:light-regulated signal transduction histidine kinase (bacteriophytochrome)
MLELINGILAYSTIDSNYTKSVRVNLRLIMDEVIDELEEVIASKSAKVAIGSLPDVNGVRQQLKSVFRNLISNSLKYSKPDIAPEIHISGTEAANEVTIVIEDNGIGFDMQYADQIFQMFRRLQSRDKYEGTGIGLAISKKIIQNHGGDITVNSQEGVGTAFTVRIPK